MQSAPHQVRALRGPALHALPSPDTPPPRTRLAQETLARCRTPSCWCSSAQVQQALSAGARLPAPALTHRSHALAPRADRKDRKYFDYESEGAAFDGACCAALAAWPFGRARARCCGCGGCCCCGGGDCGCCCCGGGDCGCGGCGCCNGGSQACDSRQAPPNRASLLPPHPPRPSCPRPRRCGEAVRGQAQATEPAGATDHLRHQRPLQLHRLAGRPVRSRVRASTCLAACLAACRVCCPCCCRVLAALWLRAGCAGLAAAAAAAAIAAAAAAIAWTALHIHAARPLTPPPPSLLLAPPPPCVVAPATGSPTCPPARAALTAIRTSTCRSAGNGSRSRCLSS